MGRYNISFERNGICQSNLADASSREAVEQWFAQHKPDAKILNIEEAGADDMRLGKPIINIE